MLGKNQRLSRPQWGTCSYSNTETTIQRTSVARQRISVRLKQAVRGDTGAGGLVAPLPCTALFGNLGIEYQWVFMRQEIRKCHNSIITLCIHFKFSAHNAHILLYMIS